MSKDLEEAKVSQILEEDDFENSYEKWSKKVIEIAEKNKKTRKKVKEWKCCRKLLGVKKSISKQMKKENNKQRREILSRRK